MNSGLNIHARATEWGYFICVGTVGETGKLIMGDL